MLAALLHRTERQVVVGTEDCLRQNAAFEHFCKELRAERDGAVPRYLRDHFQPGQRSLFHRGAVALKARLRPTVEIARQEGNPAEASIDQMPRGGMARAL